jgi:hypothetical protein
MEQPKEVPVVIYTGNKERHVVGTAIVNEDGTFTATLTTALFAELGAVSIDVRPDQFGLYRL